MTSIHDVLDHLRGSALSEADKGTKFERLVQAYLRTDPVFADQFAHVWMWGSGPATRASTTQGLTWWHRTGPPGR